MQHKVEGAAAQHGGGEVADERKSLGVEVPEHGVGAPSTDKLEHVLVDATAEEGHGAAHAQAAGSDFVRRNVKV